MGDDRLTDAQEAYANTLGAQQAFRANPTAETAFTAYRAARRAITFGASPDLLEVCEPFAICAETFALRAKDLATPQPGYASGDTITVQIAGPKLVTLLNLLEADIRTRMEKFEEYPQGAPDALVEKLNWIDTIRDILSEQRNARRDREAGVIG